jgi:hypothetical protein
MFAFLAFLFFQLSQHVASLKYVGLAFTVGLAGASGLEGLIGFCLGCWMFGLAVRFGLVSPRVGCMLPAAGCMHVSIAHFTLS